MALGLRTESVGGDFLPRIQYDAKSGKLFLVERHQDDSGNWNNSLQEIKLPVKFMIDLETVEVGWIKLDGGVDFEMVRIGAQLPTQPSDKHRQGFRVRVYSKNAFGGVRHWNHTAKCVLQALDQLHNEYLGALPANPGKVPVVEMINIMPVTTGQGTKKSTNYAPILKLSSWAARPADLGEAGAEFDETTKPTRSNGQVPPPIARVPAAAKAAVEENEFV